MRIVKGEEVLVGNRMVLLAVSVGLMFSIGCAGEVITLDIRAAQPPVSTKTDRVKVAVSVFEDSRPDNDVRADKARIGIRTHIMGGESYFNIKGGQLGPAVSQVVADYLVQRGLDAWVGKPGESKTADIVMNGRVLDCRAHANSRFGYTELAVRTKLAVEAINQTDQSAVRMTLNGEGQDIKTIFDSPDLERLLNEALNDSLKEFLQDTNIANRLMRLR
jgi:uncharacterized lipoprotein YajG